jgi:predicted nucleotidyltransferase
MKSINMDKLVHKNGLIKKELLLLKSFVKEPWKGFTLSEIKVVTGVKSHHYIFEALKKFSAMGILKESKVGKTNIYSVNPENALTISYLAFMESIIRDERKDVPYTNLLKMAEKTKSPFYIFLVGGSYAEKKQKPTSDLDVTVIIPDRDSKRPYETALKAGELMVPEVHGFVFTQEEFYLMLTNKEYNYGKELARKHIIVFGAEPYYMILMEAIRNGFKG